MKVNDFLVKHCKISNREACNLIEGNKVHINNIKALQKQYVVETDLIELNGHVLQHSKVYKYYAFYKPIGIECTLNRTIENNLRELIPFTDHFYPVGRLDKQSEGLLLITNDGQLYQQIALSKNYIEKEYEVRVNVPLSEEIIKKLASGVIIMRIKKTRPALVTQSGLHSFRIVLTQGINRQIRRMCTALNLKVISLKRIRIASILLAELQPGEYRELKRENI